MNALSFYARPFAAAVDALDSLSAFDDFDSLASAFFGSSPLEPAARRVRSGSRVPAAEFRLPAADVREGDDAYVVEVELPGFGRDAIEVGVEGSTLTVAAKAPAEGAGSDAGSYVVREREPRGFERAFALPDDADGAAVRAVYKDGVLELTVPKRPEAKRRAITIEAR